MVNRRDFVKKISVAGGGVFLSSLIGPDQLLTNHGLWSKHSDLSGQQTMDNPYSIVQWEKVEYIASASHVHVEDQEKFDKVYNQFKLRHIPISNYYPSAPAYPIEKIRYNQYMLEQDFGLVYNPVKSKTGDQKLGERKFKPGPFKWNDIIMNGPNSWIKELPADLQAKLPYKLGDFIFKNIPADVIISPNAEHDGFTNSELHSSSLGSLYSSGNFDIHDDFKTQEHGYVMGTGLPWEVVFRKMIDQLLFEDAGGITVNHPVWSGLKFEEVIKMLDFDHRVLGIEVYNDTCGTNYGDPNLGWALQMWDGILKTGRRCLGFFVPDHTIGRGKNILLVPEFNEHECLKAYRLGAFYGALSGSGLQFKKIALHGNELFVALNEESTIRIVTSAGQAQKTEGAEALYKIPSNAGGIPSISYVRIEAINETSEQIFSQPIRFIK